MKYRNESDSIGKIKVSGDKYWGASTERSNKYFNIGDFLVRPIVIQSIAMKMNMFIQKHVSLVHLEHTIVPVMMQVAMILFVNL